MSENGGATPSFVAMKMMISPQRAIHLLERLDSFNLVSPVLSMAGGEPQWLVTAEGRAELAKRGILP